MDYQEEYVALNNTFKTIVKTLCPDDSSGEIIDVMKWLDRVINYNVPYGNRNSAIYLVSTYKLMNKTNKIELSDEDVELSRILGWNVEMLQSYLMIMHDIMYESNISRGHTCWFRNYDVGLMANNDAILVDQENYHLLKVIFSDKPYYQKLVDLMHEVIRMTAEGECLQLLTNPLKGKPDFDNFTKERYDAIVKYKLSLNKFVLPVRLALYMCDYNDVEDHRSTESILTSMGLLYQMQEDYLDVYGECTQIGRDIEEGKCSYLAVKAFQLSNETQKQVLRDNLGIKDPKAVQKVIEVYNQLDLKTVFKKEEMYLYSCTSGLIDALVVKDTKLPPCIFYELYYKIYKRHLYAYKFTC